MTRAYYHFVITLLIGMNSCSKSYFGIILLIGISSCSKSYSSFITHHSLFFIRHSSFINSHSSFIVHQSSFIIHHLLVSKIRKSEKTCQSIVNCCHSKGSCCQLGACFLSLDSDHLRCVSVLKAGADDISPEASATKRKRQLVQADPFVRRLLS